MTCDDGMYGRVESNRGGRNTAAVSAVGDDKATPALPRGAIRVACIDIGTVTCRLAIADVANGRVAHMDKISTICDLGEGLSATGRISDGARERVLTCVGDYVGKAAAAGAHAVCCTLTSAARDAANSSELTSALASLGVCPQVIPGSVEGRLTFVGVATDYPNTPIIVADNGGGSTELAAGTLVVADAGAVGASVGAATPTVRDGLASVTCDVAASNTAGNVGASAQLAFVESVDVGCRRVTERFLSADAPDTPAQLAAARTFAYNALASAAERARAALPGANTLVTCGGTVTSLVAIRDALVPYDPACVHGVALTLSEVEALATRLAALSVTERAQVPGLQPKRAPVILGGALTVAELLRALDFASLTVSEHDLLVGLSLAAAAAVTGAATPDAWLPTLAPLPREVSVRSGDVA